METHTSVIIDGTSCRYCLEEVSEHETNVHRPCDCRSYVHDECLTEWANMQNRRSCEICKGRYATVSTTIKQWKCNVFKKHLITICKWIYIVLGCLSIPFTTSIVIFAFSLLDKLDENPGAFIAMTFITMITTLATCFVTTRIGIYNEEFSLMRLSTIYFLICITCIVIQCLSCVIANPILGRPIAFTPRGETFGIMAGIFIGIGLICLAVLGTVVYIKRYCIGSENVQTYVDKETVSENALLIGTAK